jgi:hypothetical protein
MQFLRFADGREARELTREPAHPTLAGTRFADVELDEIVGVGRRCVAYSARRHDQALVLKSYHPQATARHAVRTGGSLARYEYERNAALHRIPGLASSIAAPVAYWSSPREEFFLQQRVAGETLDSFLRNCSARHHERLLSELRTVLDCAHGVGLYDLDLHPGNVLVQRRTDGSGRPLLFDFNKVPYHQQPPNRLCGWLVALGLLGPRSRDRRLWRRLARLRGNDSVRNPAAACEPLG